MEKKLLYVKYIKGGNQEQREKGGKNGKPLMTRKMTNNAGDSIYSTSRKCNNQKQHVVQMMLASRGKLRSLYISINDTFSYKNRNR